VQLDEYVRLVMAEAWLIHLDEVYSCSESAAPFRGDPQDHIERLVATAARNIHGFLTCSVPVWHPRMCHPRSGGLHRAIDRLVGLRIRARGGGCEVCHAESQYPLDLHHLHYRSFGFEVP
jgi:hypothetical protein